MLARNFLMFASIVRVTRLSLPTASEISFTALLSRSSSSMVRSRVSTSSGVLGILATVPTIFAANTSEVAANTSEAAANTSEIAANTAEVAVNVSGITANRIRPARNFYAVDEMISFASVGGCHCLGLSKFVYRFTLSRSSGPIHIGLQ